MAETPGTETNHRAQWWQMLFTAYGTDPGAKLKEQYVRSEYKVIINSSDQPITKAGVLPLGCQLQELLLPIIPITNVWCS